MQFTVQMLSLTYMCCMQGAAYNHYDKHDWNKYKTLITVDVDVPGTSDVISNEPGKNLKYPKVYVGFFSHSAHPRPDTSIKVNAGRIHVQKRRDIH